MKGGKKGLLVITELFLPTKGGTAVWFDEVYRRLGGKEIHIVTAEVPGSIGHDSNHPNTVHRLRLDRHWWLRPESLAIYAKLLTKSLQVATSHSIEAIHAGRVLPEGLVGWLVARFVNKPLVIYAHGEEITTWRQSAKFRAMVFTYRHAKRIIANSEFTLKELMKLGVARERIALIYPGVDIERFRPGLACDDLRQMIGHSPEQKLFLSVGRLSRRKGFDTVIKTLPMLLQQGMDVHYALIGIGEDWSYLHELAEQNAVSDRVHFLGHVPAEDLPRWYNACDVFVMPNREINGDTEGFGMVFIEAGACKKPVIAGKAGGTGAAVKEGVTGIRVDGDDQGAFLNAAVKLLKDETMLDQFGSAGYERTHSQFSWDRVAHVTQACMSIL